MKLVSLISLLALAAPAVQAQLEPKSSAVAGGGITSASVDQRFRLDATVGQAEAAPVLSSGNGRFAMEPGFWHGITVIQTLEAPILTIRSARNGHVILSWPATATGFVLEETPTLGQTKWTETKADVVDTAAEHTATVPAAGVMKCYRLKKL